jgi:hypothetical protein
VYNDVESVIRSQRALLESFYDDPKRTLEGWRAFLAALESGALSMHPELIEPLMRANDERAIAAFRERIKKGTSHEPANHAPRGSRHSQHRKTPRRARA